MSGKRILSLFVLATDVTEAYDRVTCELEEKRLTKKRCTPSCHRCLATRTVTKKINNMPQCGNDIIAPQPRKIPTKERPNDTFDLRGRCGRVAGAPRRNLSREKAWISRSRIMDTCAGIRGLRVVVRKYTVRTRKMFRLWTTARMDSQDRRMYLDVHARISGSGEYRRDGTRPCGEEG